MLGDPQPKEMEDGRIAEIRHHRGCVYTDLLGSYHKVVESGSRRCIQEQERSPGDGGEFERKGF